MSELKCCRICDAFVTCETKSECCPECHFYDPADNLCMTIPDRKKAKAVKSEESEEIDPDTFLFEDDDDEEDC